MTTSLAEQLRKLAVPQTSQLIHETKRASLLFDPKEAAAIDRNVIYDIGVSGLEELKKMNPKFSTFSDTLFSLSSHNFQRAVESQEVNQKINETIKEFLTYLSPYFLLKPAHQALEWLIVRYEIHLYNKEDVIFLILPYHDTNMFIRVLQLLKLKNETDHWHWLYKCQKNGVALSKTALLNRCSSDLSFLKFICDGTISAIRIHGGDANRLVTLIAFYCTTVIGGLDHSKQVSEVQVVHILKPLLEGFSSRLADFASASFMITAQLANKTQMSQKVLFSLINNFVKNKLESTRKLKALLLVLLYQTQENLKAVPKKAMIKLSKTKWFPAELADLAAKGSHVIPFLVPLLRDVLKHIQTTPFQEKKLAREFFQSLLSSVSLKESDVKSVVRSVVEAFNVDLLKDEDTRDTGDVNVVKWFSEIVKHLEKRYPSEFDAAVKELWTVEKGKKVLDIVLGYHGTMSVFEKLLHPSPEMRISALNYVVTNFSTIQDQENLKHSLSLCLQDENLSVVQKLLKLPLENLISILGSDFVLDSLIKLCVRCQQSDNISVDVKVQVLKCLCSSHVFSSGLTDARILLSVLPFFFPCSDVEVCCAVEVLHSEFADNNKLISAIKSDFESSSSQAAKDLCSITWKHINTALSICDKDILLEAVDEIPVSENNVVSKLVIALILPSILCGEKSEPAASLIVVKKIFNIYKSCKVFTKSKDIDITEKTLSWLFQSARNGKLGTEVIVHSLILIMQRTPLGGTLLESLWWELIPSDCRHSDFDMTEFLIYSFDLLVTRCSVESPKSRGLFILGLKEFFKTYFPSLELQLQFLCKIVVACSLSLDDLTIVNMELQLRSLRLLHSLMQQNKDSLSSVLGLSSPVFPSLLIALSSTVTQIRTTALQCFSVLNESRATIPNKSGYSLVLNEVLERYTELKMDSGYILTVMDVCFSKMPSSKNVALILHTLLDYAVNMKTPVFVSSALLKLIIYNSEDVLLKLITLGNRILAEKKHEEELDSYRSSILRNIIQKLDESCSAILQNEKCWKFYNSALHDTHTILWDADGKAKCLAVIAMNQITAAVFESLASLRGNLQQQMYATFIEVSTAADISDIATATGRVVRKWSVDAEVIVKELDKMRDATFMGDTPSARRRSKTAIPSLQVLQSLHWKRGVTVLEFLQSMKRVQNVHLLLPILFGLLKRCLEFDEQMSLEYTKQLILSSILKCSEELKKRDDLVMQSQFSTGVLDANTVVDCIRRSQNPQTHHHAFLVLSHLADIIPSQVLHNSMSIFTFIGDSLVRYDDTYSFQIISKTIDTIVPILIQTHKKNITSENDPLPVALAKILRVFCSAMLGIPEHRRVPLFKNLLTTMGPQSSLWLFMCLVIEIYVFNDTENKGAQSLHNTPGDMPERLKLCLELCVSFPPHVVMHSGILVMEYVRSLPLEIQSKDDRIHKTNEFLFDISLHSPAKFRHFKYALSSFLSSLLSSTSLINKVAALDDSASCQMEPLYTKLIENILEYIHTLSKVSESNAAKPTAKYWKVMLHENYVLLEKVNALLPSDMFLVVIRGLLDNKLPAVRRKAMELLNSRFQQQATVLVENNLSALFSVLPSLASVVSTIGETSEDKVEVELNQQMALMSLKLLTRYLSADHPQCFKEVLSLIIKLLNSDLPHDNILGGVILCLAELISGLRAKSVTSLSKFMPPLLSILKKQRHCESPNLLVLSIVSAVHKIVETLGNFLSPYFNKLLFEICVMSSKLEQSDTANKYASVIQKLKSTRQKITSCVTARVLLPAVNICYFDLIKMKQYAAIEHLMSILAESFPFMNPSELIHHQPELTNFFTQALQFRCDNSEDDSMWDEVSFVEGHVVEAIVALVLKLSESSFKPLYFSLFHWATSIESHKDRTITFYRLSCSIAESLKGLFVLFAGHFLKNAATLLDANNLMKSKTLHFGTGELSVKKAETLLNYILKTLHAVFLHDRQKFINKERFDSLMQPIVDQFENNLGGIEGLSARNTSLVIPCVTQLAVAVADDALWKDLNYQILLKTRHSTIQVRLAALRAVCEIARNLGEDFLPFLPETIPFLAELLEDEDEEVEKETRRVVQDLEEILGEPLQKYF